MEPGIIQSSTLQDLLKKKFKPVVTILFAVKKKLKKNN